MGMRLILLLLLICAEAHAWRLHPQESPPPNSPFVERAERQFDFYPGGKIQITGAVPGNFRIMGWGRASVRIESERVIYDLGEDKAKELSKQFPLQLHRTETSITVRTAGPPQSAASMEVNVTMYVPKDKTDLVIHLAQGDLAVHEINGWVEATLDEGSLEAKSLRGYFSAVTQKGDLNIIMTGKHWDGQGLTAVTRRGSVLLQLPMEYSAALQMQTREGEMSIEYPEQLVDGERVPLTFTRQKKASLLTATVGAGGAPIRLQTVAGNMRLIGVSP
jgi:hypothetical protein